MEKLGGGERRHGRHLFSCWFGVPAANSVLATKLCEAFEYTFISYSTATLESRLKIDTHLVLVNMVFTVTAVERCTMLSFD